MAKTTRKKKSTAKKAKARKVCMLVPANKKVKLVYKKGAKRKTSLLKRAKKALGIKGTKRRKK